MHHDKFLITEPTRCTNFSNLFFPARKLSANLYDIYHCSMYSEKFLMMDGGTVRNMYNLILIINLIN